MISPVSYSWPDGIAFARRQYTFLRWSAPRRQVLSAFSHSDAVVGWIVALPLAFAGNRIAIALTYCLDMLRGILRLRVPREIVECAAAPAHGAARSVRSAPAWVMMHGAVIWSTLFKRIGHLGRPHLSRVRSWPCRRMSMAQQSPPPEWQLRRSFLGPFLSRFEVFYRRIVFRMPGDP